MHTSKFRPIVVSVSKNFSRSVSATAEKVQVNETTPLKSWKDIPGPTSLPIIGPLHHFFPGGMFYNLNGLALTTKFYETYGPIVRLDASVARGPIIFLFDAESASQIWVVARHGAITHSHLTSTSKGHLRSVVLAGQCTKILHGENWYPVRPGFESLKYYRQNLKEGVKKGSSSGLGVDHYELWKELRSMVNPVLLHKNTIKLYAGVLDEVAMDMIDRMKSQRDDKNMLKGNFDYEMNLWALESIGIVALGCRLGCLNPNLQENSPSKRLINCVREMFILVDKLDYKPSLWRIVSTPNFKKAMALYEQQESLAKHFINQAVREFKTKNKSDDEKGVLEKLLEINEHTAHVMASDMLYGGVDTTANTITSTLYLLAVNPEKQKKLRDELRSGDETKPYLKAIIKESLRAMPVTPGNLRITKKEYNLLGYKIPSNTEVVLAHHDMSLMEEHFPRSKEFLPERWLVDKDDPLHYKHAHPFAYNPFGFGVRSCIGRRIAELEIETFITRLVENFQVKWFGPPPKVQNVALNYVRGPFNFIFKDAPE